MDSGAAHPVMSRVDADYATALRSQGIAASPEILLFEVVNNQPFLARGADYKAFAAVTNATLVRGQTPKTPPEAVIGEDLATSLEVGVGDSLLLGGSNHPAVTRVTIVGVYTAPRLQDNQLIVSLPTARHLSNVGEGAVNLIRTENSDDSPLDETDEREKSGDEQGSGISVVNFSAPSQVKSGTQFTVSVTVRNGRPSRETRSVRVTVANTSRTQKVTLGSDTERTVDIELSLDEPGSYSLSVEDDAQSVTVVDEGALRIGRVPASVPANTTLLAKVSNATGDPVRNVSLTIGTRSARTDQRGVAELLMPAPGNYTLAATKSGWTPASQTVEVTAGSRKTFLASVQVTPSRPSILTKPTARVRLRNPWNESLTRRIRLSGPGRDTLQNITVSAGGEETISSTLGRASPGKYRVTVQSGDRTLAVREYTVRGDDRVVSALASSGRYTEGTGLGRAVSSAFGNLSLLLATLVVLAGLMTVGGTTAAFAQAVHARRHTIGVHRSTGASPVRILGSVLTDATQIGILAALPALVIGFISVQSLASVGMLTIFGITLVPSTAVSIFIGTAIGAVGLALLGAVIATIPLIRTRPAKLLGASRTADTDHNRSEYPDE